MTMPGFWPDALSELPQVELDPTLVQTNIVIFSLRGEGDAEALVSALASRGVLAGTVGPHSIRLVTHHDVDRAACERAARFWSRRCKNGTADKGRKKSEIRQKRLFWDLYYVDAKIFDRRALPQRGRKCNCAI